MHRCTLALLALVIGAGCAPAPGYPESLAPEHRAVMLVVDTLGGSEYYCAGSWVGPSTVLTAAHCLDHHPLAVDTYSGVRARATEICRDEDGDIALLRTPGYEHPHHYRIGPPWTHGDDTWIATIGAPWGEGWTTTEGSRYAVLEEDARLWARLNVHPGDSGGGVRDRRGRIVGVVSAKVIGTGFAVIAATPRSPENCSTF